MSDQENAAVTYGLSSQGTVRDRVGFAVESRNAVDAVNIIRQAEEAGVRQVWMTQGGAGAGDILTIFAAAIAQTRHIRMGSAIVSIYPRHPMVMAQQALTLNDLAPQRLRLGIGPSHRPIIEDMYGLSMEAPLAHLKEYMEILRAVLQEGKVDHQGRFFNVAIPAQRPSPLPLLISALGKKAFRTAGEIADGAISWLCPVPYLLDSALPELRAGATSRQRPAPPLVAHILVALSTDEAAAQATCRQRLQGYARLPFYAHMFAEAGFPVTEDGSGLDALASTLVVAGNATTVQRRLEELLASGLDELLVMSLPVADKLRERSELIQLIGSLPD